MEIGASALLTQPGTSDLRHMRANTHNYIPQEKSEIFNALLCTHCIHFAEKNIRSDVIILSVAEK
jgi:hypothetical protein